MRYWISISMFLVIGICLIAAVMQPVQAETLKIRCIVGNINALVVLDKDGNEIKGIKPIASKKLIGQNVSVNSELGLVRWKYQSNDMWFDEDQFIFDLGKFSPINVNRKKNAPLSGAGVGTPGDPCATDS